MTNNRNPATIAAELTHHIDRADSAFVPVNIRTGLDLAAEFMAATASALIAAGLIVDPDAAPVEPPQ